MADLNGIEKHQSSQGILTMQMQKRFVLVIVCGAFYDPMLMEAFAYLFRLMGIEVVFVLNPQLDTVEGRRRMTFGTYVDNLDTFLDGVGSAYVFFYSQSSGGIVVQAFLRRLRLMHSKPDYEVVGNFLDNSWLVVPTVGWKKQFDIVEPRAPEIVKGIRMEAGASDDNSIAPPFEKFVLPMLMSELMTCPAVAFELYNRGFAGRRQPLCLFDEDVEVDGPEEVIKIHTVVMVGKLDQSGPYRLVGKMAYPHAHEEDLEGGHMGTAYAPLPTFIVMWRHMLPIIEQLNPHFKAANDPTQDAAAAQ